MLSRRSILRLLRLALAATWVVAALFLLAVGFFHANRPSRLNSWRGGADAVNAGHDDGGQQHVHVIPTRHLFFTHHKNLLAERTEDLSPKYQRLKANVESTIAIHRAYETRESGQTNLVVDFLDDPACEVLINSTRAIPDAADRAELLRHFRKEDGPFKGDMCRVVALYKSGGLYFDVDMFVRMPVPAVIRPDTTFVTVREIWSDCFFQSFIGATAGHVVLRTYLEYTLEYYRGQRELRGSPNIGPALLRDAYDAHTKDDGDAVVDAAVDAVRVRDTSQIFQETARLDNFFTWVRTPPQEGVLYCFDDIVVYDSESGLTPFFSRLARIKSSGCGDGPEPSHANPRGVFDLLYSLAVLYVVLGGLALWLHVLLVRCGWMKTISAKLHVVVARRRGDHAYHKV